jgi:3-oxoadipate enol-lactonase/4-carboxymuconolactone decarboxylase
VTIELAYRFDGPDRASAPNGPVLVLLNSMGTSTAMWEPCLGPLAEQFTVLRVDARGHGASPVAAAGTPCGISDLALDVVAVLDRLDLGRVHIAGCSLGAMAGLWIAAHRPERVGRLAVMCTSAGPLADSGYRARGEAVRRGGLDSVADAVVDRWLTAAIRERDPELVATVRSMLTSTDAESYAQCCDALVALDLRADLARIAAPTLVMTGDQDEALPPVHGQRIAEGIAGARLESLGAAAHIATYEQPGRIVSLLLEHFQAGATWAGGLAVRRSVLGDEHVDRALREATTMTLPFQEFLTRYAWGDVWARPQLSRRDRSLITLTALVALGAEHEIPMHVRAAVRNGLSEQEIGEAMLHAALYAGLPRANRALAIARDVLDS